MKKIENIIQILRERIHLIVPLALVLFLSSCGDLDDCDTMQSYIASGCGSNCLFCDLFELVCDAAKNAAKQSWDHLSHDLQGLVVIVTAVYIALFTLKNLGSFTKQNVSDYLTGDKKGVLFLAAKAAVVVLLLKESSSNSFLIKLIFSILQGGSEIGLTLGGSDSSAAITVSKLTGEGIDDVFDLINAVYEGFNDLIYENFIAIGQALSCYSLPSIWPWEWEFSMLIYGCILVVFGWIILFSVSFYLIDILINMAIAMILLPFGIACAVAPHTSKYSKKIWNIFINTFFSFVMMGIMIGLSAKMIQFTFNPAISEGGESAFAAMLLDESVRQSKIDENGVEALADMLEESGSLLLTIICLGIALKLFEGIGLLVEKISQTNGLSKAASQTAGAVSEPIVNSVKNNAKKRFNNMKESAKNSAIGRGVARTGDFIGDRLSRTRGLLTGTGKYGYANLLNKRGRANAAAQFGSDMSNAAAGVKKGLKGIKGWLGW